MLRGVWVVPVSRLVEWLSSRPAVLDRESAGRAVTRAMTDFPSTTTDPELLAAIGHAAAEEKQARRRFQLGTSSGSGDRRRPGRVVSIASASTTLVCCSAGASPRRALHDAGKPQPPRGRDTAATHGHRQHAGRPPLNRTPAPGRRPSAPTPRPSTKATAKASPKAKATRAPAAKPQPKPPAPALAPDGLCSSDRRGGRQDYRAQGSAHRRRNGMRLGRQARRRVHDTGEHPHVPPRRHLRLQVRDVDQAATRRLRGGFSTPVTDRPPPCGWPPPSRSVPATRRTTAGADTYVVVSTHKLGLTDDQARRKALAIAAALNN